jgi:hypothetical protein
MARYVDYPATECEPALHGWCFDHRATGEPVGPFSTKEACLQAEHQHHIEPFEMPMWALYQS